MNELGDYIFDIAMVLSAVWIVKRFWGSFFVKKIYNVLSVGILSAYCVLQLLFQTNKGNDNAILTMFNILLILLIAVSGYDCRGRAKYFLLVIFCAVWLLSELLILFTLSNLPMESKNANMLGEVISKILMMVLVYILSLFQGRNKGELVSNKLYLWFSFIPVGSICIAISEFNTTADMADSMVVVGMLLVFNIIIYELYIKMNETYIHDKENIVYTQQLEIAAGNTAEQKKIMEEFHEEKHNLLNEFIVLKELIAGGKYKDAVKYIDEAIDSSHSAEHISSTGNSTVDAIINFKYSVARAYGIEFYLKIFIPEEIPVEQKDMGVVLGNALDNAIEAVKNCKSKEKKIEIALGIKKEAWILVMKNPYEKEIRTSRTGELVSNKPDQKKHGYGMKSIKKISEKYHGEVIVDMDGGLFSLTVILNFG